MTTVLVLGMHRSGTSAVSRLLDSMGLATCRPEAFMRAHPSNPHGHFEVRELTDLNDEILRALGGTWQALAPGTDDHQRELARSELGRRARRRADQLLVPGDRFWKDPRLCLLMPFWTAVLDDLAALVVHRHPAEVAASIQTRSGLSQAHALALWQASMHGAIGAAAALPSLVIAYDDVVSRPADTADEVTAFLTAAGIALRPVPVDAAAVDPHARHHRDLGVELDDSQQRLLAHLEATVGAPATPADDDAAPSADGAALLAAVAAATAAVDTELVAARDEARAASDERRRRVDELSDLVEHERARRVAAERTVRRLVDPLRRSGVTVAARSLRSLGRRALTEPEARAHLGTQLRSALRPGTARQRPMAPVRLAASTTPTASLVVPVHGRVDLTSRFLASLADNEPSVPYEVVVVDDASPDGGATAAHLAACGGIRVLTNDTNLGYLRSVNRGAAAAAADVIVLLNNDIEVRPGWLEALLDELSDPTVGAVGARMLAPDGTIGEAGAVMFADGTGHQFARGTDGENFRAQYPRDVDYCSAACLAVRRELWDDIGGYDERFAPAYYEDVDLCFALRERGYRVRYRPDAVIVHDEGGTHGTDPTAGGKAHQVTNRAVFVAKWAHRLTDHGDPTMATVARRADRAPGRSILVVDAAVPALDESSGGNRMFRLVTHLRAQGHRVRVYPADTQQRHPAERALQRAGVEVAYGTIDPDGYLAQLHGDVDVAILSRPRVAVQWMERLRATVDGVAIVYDMVDHHGRRAERRRELSALPSWAPTPGADRAEAVVAGIERLMIEAADLTLAISEDERAAVEAEVPGARVRVVANVHDAPRSTTPFTDRGGVLFVGSWAHPPNRDALDWLVGELAPTLAERLPDVEVHIAGNGVPPDVGADAPNVVNHGFVADLDELYDRVRVVVAPLRYGAGLKGKVGEALVRGIPVVTTPIGVEGFEFDDGVVAVAGDAAGLVEEVVALHTDAQRWVDVADRARDAVVARHGIGVVGEALETALDEALGGAGPRGDGTDQ